MYFAGENGRIRYHLSKPSSNFGINVETGVVYALRTLDAERITEPEILEVVAEDSGVPPRSGTTTLRVSIKDFNDNVPVFVKKRYEFATIENAPVDTLVGQVVAIDGDLNPTVVYSIRRTIRKMPFAIDEQTGEIFVARSIDFESDPSEFNLTAVATDQDGQKDTTVVIIRVVDLNDNTPVVEYPLPNRDVVWVDPNLRTGQVVARIRATDSDSGKNGAIRIIPESSVDFLNVDPLGEIVLQRDLTTADHGRHSISVRVKDQGEPTAFILLHVSHLTHNLVIRI